MPTEKKKTNRRAEITKTAIREGMLTLLEHTSFQNVSVASLCREAGIGRATFYTHYTGVMDVVDELADEAIQAAEEKEGDPLAELGELAEKIQEMGNSFELEPFMHLLPLCQRVAHTPRFNVLFRDHDISEYIIMRIYRRERARTVPALMKRTGLPESRADKLFLFGVMGAFAVNRSMGWKKDEEWEEVQKLLLTYANGGYEAVASLCKSREENTF